MKILGNENSKVNHLKPFEMVKKIYKYLQRNKLFPTYRKQKLNPLFIVFRTNTPKIH